MLDKAFETPTLDELSKLMYSVEYYDAEKKVEAIKFL